MNSFVTTNQRVQDVSRKTTWLTFDSAQYIYVCVCGKIWDIK